MGIREIIEELDAKSWTELEQASNLYIEKYKVSVGFFEKMLGDKIPSLRSFLADSFILLCSVYGIIEDSEYKFYAEYMSKIGSEVKSLEYCKNYHNAMNEDNIKSLASTIRTMGGIDDSFLDTYKRMAACIFLMNTYDDEEINFIEEIDNGVDVSSNTESVGQSSVSSNTISNNSTEPVKLERMGANLTSDENYSYLNVGVEIRNPNKTKCAKNVEVKIIVKDANNRILETNTYTIDYIDSNKLFCYGAEFYIERGSPANYTVQINCDEYVDSPADSTFANGIEVSHFNVEKSNWGDSRIFTGNIENKYNKKLDIDLFFVFYDADNNIVGGCRTSKWGMYGNSEDGFEISLDAYPQNTNTVTAHAAFNFMDLMD